VPKFTEVVCVRDKAASRGQSRSRRMIAPAKDGRSVACEQGFYLCMCMLNEHYYVCITYMLYVYTCLRVRVFLGTRSALFCFIDSINKNLISLSHSKHTHSPRNAHSARAEGTDPV